MSRLPLDASDSQPPHLATGVRQLCGDPPSLVVVTAYRVSGPSPCFCRTPAISIGMRFTLDGESFELTPELVRARLAGHVPEAVREYWVEIDGTRWPVKQVISLATGVSDRQRFQSQSSRRWLQNLGFTIEGGGKRKPAAPTPQRGQATTKQRTASAALTPARRYAAPATALGAPEEVRGRRRRRRGSPLDHRAGQSTESPQGPNPD